MFDGKILRRVVRYLEDDPQDTLKEKIIEVFDSLTESQKHQVLAVLLTGATPSGMVMTTIFPLITLESPIGDP